MYSILPACSFLIFSYSALTWASVTGCFCR
ncbi:Uncharacterised protein [Bordetella pertussis]|nr:Uncharacterised protein [Bordetella pertussis]